MMSEIGDVRRCPATLPVLITFLILLFVLAVSVSAAPLWRHVTVVSVEGWRYDDVTVYLSDDVDKLVIRHSDSSRTILEFKQVSSVRNFEGEDITTYVYDPSLTETDQYAPPPPPAKVAPADPYFQKSRFRSAVGLQFGGSIVVGDGYAWRDGNVMVQGSIRSPISQTGHVGFAYAYQRIHVWGSTKGLGDFGQHEVHALIGLQQKARNYRHVIVMADIGPGFKLYNYRSTGSGLIFSIYGGVSLVVPTNKTNAFIFELNARRVSNNGISGHAIGLSIGFLFMQI